MSEIDNREINKNYKSVKLVKIPILGGMYPSMFRKQKFLNVSIKIREQLQERTISILQFIRTCSPTKVRF